jgi:hypothetical protein
MIGASAILTRIYAKKEDRRSGQRKSLSDRELH